MNSLIRTYRPYLRSSPAPFTKKAITTSCSSQMPYKPEERLPMSERQKRLYPQVEQQYTEEGYPVLNLFPSNRNIFELRPKYLPKPKMRADNPIRETRMDENQDWPSVWPTAKTFVPSAVPLPLRQSFEDRYTPRGKYCNTELQKVVNFLHLTPNAIERQCKALKKFCTKWPEGLDTDEDVRHHFPVTFITTDYVHTSPTIRDPKARIVVVKININDLKLNDRDRDKLIRIAAHRYNQKTDEITIQVDACPTKVQNSDYGEYLLTALYHESLNHEKWEDEKPECDWECFFWDKSESKRKVKTYTLISKPNLSDDVIEKGEGDELVEDYRNSLEKVYQKEDLESLDCYRTSVEKLIGLQAKKPVNIET